MWETIALIFVPFFFFDIHYFVRASFIFFYYKCQLLLYDAPHPLEETKYPTLCWFTDLDFNLHMNNSKYLRDMDMSRFQHYILMGIDKKLKAINDQAYIVNCGNWIKYRRSINLFQRFDVTCKLVYWDEKAAYFEQLFVNPNNGFIHAFAYAKLQFVGISTLEYLTKNVNIESLEPPAELLKIIEANELNRKKSMIVRLFSCDPVVRPMRMRQTLLSSVMSSDELSELCSIGNYQQVEKFLQQTNPNIINGKNKVNKWTPLHWACKRNHLDIAKLLILSKGDVDAKNDKDETPGELTTSSEIKKFVNEERSRRRLKLIEKKNEEDKLDILPNYLKFPQVNSFTQMEAKENNQLIMLRVKIEKENDFYEIETDIRFVSLNDLIKLIGEKMSKILQKTIRIKNIRRLPNTIIHNDVQISKLNNFDELELILF
ncbi:hypothetical protein SNEBB_008293 [Seison nebaliae]|nr:hypothetical protein SNEBB_008293 [Seison nebaliae]